MPRRLDPASESLFDYTECINSILPMLLIILLQEMVKEYFGGLAKSKGATCSRLNVYLSFDQEPLTPAEYQDGYTFFKSSR